MDYLTENDESFYKSLFKNNQEIMLLINPKTSGIEDCKNGKKLSAIQK